MVVFARYQRSTRHVKVGTGGDEKPEISFAWPYAVSGLVEEA